MLKIIDRYILREIVPPFLVGLLVTTFALLMNQVLTLAELLIVRGVAAGTAARLLLLLVPSLLAFAVPMAVLAGVLGGLARLSADSEVVAFRTLGIGPGRLLRPLLVFGLGGFLVTAALALVLAPQANFRWVQVLTESVLSRAELHVRPLEFNESLPGVVLYVQEVGRDKGWENVFAYLGKDAANPRVVMARKGRIHIYPEERRATLELLDGTIHSGKLADPAAYSVTSFARFEEEVDVANLFPVVTSEKRVREKDIGELFRDAGVVGREMASLDQAARADPRSGEAALLAAAKRREFRAHWVEIHKKFALPFACFIFVFLGLPLGLMTGRSGRTGGLALSLGVILLYYVMITMGEKLAMDGKLTAFLGMWGPGFVLAGVGLLLFLRAGEESDLFSRLSAVLGRMKRPAAPPRPGRPAPRLPRWPLRFPGILDRYVARKYLAVLVLVLTGLLAASVLAAFFERLDVVHRNGKPLGLLVQHVWFRVPEFLAAVLPMASLTTALLALGLLVRTNEVTAMKAAGVSLYRAVVPILVLGAAVSAAAFLVQERLAPAAGMRAEETWNVLNNRPARRYSTLNRHWIMARTKDRIYHYEYFEPGSSRFSRLSVFDLDTERWALARRYYAERASVGADGLVLGPGWVRDFRPGAPAPLAVRPSGTLAEVDGRGYFLREWKEPEQMTYGELRGYAAEVRSMGFAATRLRVDLGGKLSFPLASLVMTLLAVPFGLFFGRKGVLVGGGVSVVLAIAYWGTFAVFRSLGYTGVLTPFLAAWGANLLFGLAGGFGLFKLRT